MFVCCFIVDNLIFIELKNAFFKNSCFENKISLAQPRAILNHRKIKYKAFRDYLASIFHKF